MAIVNEACRSPHQGQGSRRNVAAIWLYRIDLGGCSSLRRGGFVYDDIADRRPSAYCQRILSRLSRAHRQIVAFAACLRCSKGPKDDLVSLPNPVGGDSSE